jgi:hypothetical protein
VEAKLGDSDVSPALRYLRGRFPETETWQVSLGRKDDQTADGIRVCPAVLLFDELV